MEGARWARRARRPSPGSLGSPTSPEGRGGQVAATKPLSPRERSASAARQVRGGREPLNGDEQVDGARWARRARQPLTGSLGSPTSPEGRGGQVAATQTPLPPERKPSASEAGEGRPGAPEWRRAGGGCTGGLDTLVGPHRLAGLADLSRGERWLGCGHPNPLPPGEEAERSEAGEGRARSWRLSSTPTASAIRSTAQSRSRNTSSFVNRSIRQPRSVRNAARCASVSGLSWLSPSTSITSFAETQQKSATTGPIGSWRRKRMPAMRPARRRLHSRRSGCVMSARRERAWSLAAASRRRFRMWVPLDAPACPSPGSLGSPTFPRGEVVWASWQPIHGSPAHPPPAPPP